jgi:hypothetical protein
LKNEEDHEYDNNTDALIQNAETIFDEEILRLEMIRNALLSTREEVKGSPPDV